MKVIRAKKLGFCSGVRRAVDLAYEEASASGEDQQPVYTLGPLIHNPHVLEELKRRGVEILIEDRLPENLHGASVIIRAHGVSPQTEAELRRRGAAVIDATCPRVKSSQLKAAAFAKDGYRLFLAGEERHAEITGIRGYYEAAPNAPLCIVVSSAVEAEKAAAQLREYSPNAKTALIGQTTISAEEYRSIAEAIAPFFPGLEVAQTICAATRERQDSLREMLNKVDAIIIAGGKDSANTRRLLAIAEAAGKPCALVENPADIPPDFSRFDTIGLASGASTPDTVIDDIEHRLGLLCYNHSMDFIINPDERRILLADARESIAAELEGRKPQYQRKSGATADNSVLRQPCGAFVTLHKQSGGSGRSLRGCIGRMTASLPLEEVVRVMAHEAAFGDPRFPPLRPGELEQCHIEISALSPMSVCPDPQQVEVGVHGLYLIRGGRAGVLLPQVPVEQGWNRDEYLDYICVKAGLPPESYNAPDATLYTFTAVVFGEE